MGETLGKEDAVEQDEMGERLGPEDAVEQDAIGERLVQEGHSGTNSSQPTCYIRNEKGIFCKHCSSPTGMTCVRCNKQAHRARN